VETSRTLTKFWAYLRGSFWTEGPLLWAKLFALSSLIFLISVILSGNFQEIYRNLLLGFVPFYIIAVQHATIPFPKIKGGLFKISAYLSFPFMLLGYFLNSLAFKLGFLLFLSFQLLPLIYYRLKISKKIYDRISYVFMSLAFFAGVFSLFLDGKAFLHALFLGFELGMFLGCMAWMLPRFSKNPEDVGKIAYLSPALFFIALFLNLSGFISGNYLTLKFAPIFAILSILIFWQNFRGKFFTPFLHIPFLYFILGFTLVLLMKVNLHPRFVSSAMVGFTILMGSKWFPIIFGQIPKKIDPILKISIFLISLAPFFQIFYNIFSLTFYLWVIRLLSRIIPSSWK